MCVCVCVCVCACDRVCVSVFLHVDQSDAFDYCTLLSSKDQVKNKSVCVHT